ncbi:unnamed protein product, partial [Coregonus sp. 'balchen']
AILILHQDWAHITDDAAPSLVLSLYSGEEDSKGLYHVFDVEKGMKHYGPGGGYNLFAGKDTSLAFVTVDFTDTSLTDDVSSLSSAQVVALADLLSQGLQACGCADWWGRIYSDGGEPTEALLQAEAALEDGQRLKAQAHAENGVVQRLCRRILEAVLSWLGQLSLCVQNSSTVGNPNIQD